MIHQGLTSHVAKVVHTDCCRFLIEICLALQREKDEKVWKVGA